MNREVLKGLAAGLCVVLVAGAAVAGPRKEGKSDTRQAKAAASRPSAAKAKAKKEPAKRAASASRTSARPAASRMNDTQSAAWSAQVAQTEDAARWVAGRGAAGSPLAAIPPRAAAPRIPSRAVKGFHAPDAYFVLQKEVATALLERDLEKAEGACRAQILLRPDRSLPYYNLATVHSLRGHQDLAIESLTRAQERGFGFPDLLFSDPDLSRLHAHALWPQLIERAKSIEQAAVAERASGVIGLTQHGFTTPGAE